MYPFMYQLPHNLPGLCKQITVCYSMTQSSMPRQPLNAGLFICICAGVFHTKNNVDDGMAWEGVIKYSIGAVLEIPAATPAQRVTVCDGSGWGTRVM